MFNELCCTRVCIPFSVNERGNGQEQDFVLIVVGKWGKIHLWEQNVVK